jgi:hypothetical protein
MRRLIYAAAVGAALAITTTAGAAGWTTTVPLTNQVATSPTTGGGYPNPPGSSGPVPGTCRLGKYNSNHSESWLAVQPGNENLVGTSKLFFEKFSTFYNFHLGAVSMPNGAPAGTVQIPGYDCVSTGTNGQLNQAMPPSWTNDTDPNVDFDSKGRAYQVTLPFNAYWTNLHPNGAIGAVYSDNLGKTWTVANGGKYLELSNNQSSFAFGGFQDKQWVAVNHVPGSTNIDNVYAAWAVFSGNNAKIHVSVSRDRGATFSAPIDVSVPSQMSGNSNTYVYPSIDARGDLYLAAASFDNKSGWIDADIYVTRSTTDGASFEPWRFVARARGNPGDFANGNFRDGILESFATSQTFPGHLYVAYEDWDGGQMDVRLAESLDGGFTWRSRPLVDPIANLATTDQLQPEVAAGPNGAVAVAWYDRRGRCPSNASVAPANRGAANTCVDVSVQPYKETTQSTYAAKVGDNVRITKYAYDPSQPVQHVDGLGQQACSGHDDPCSEVFLGDYFGLAISAGNIYGFFVSTHYPSGVNADEGGPVYYQQQILATVPRSAFGLY